MTDIRKMAEEYQCKVERAFSSYVRNVTETAKRCYIDAARIVFKKPSCKCKKCEVKIGKK